METDPRMSSSITMMDFIGMIFISMYKVLGLFLFFINLLLMVQGGFRLVITVCRLHLSK
jgi:hypothetical protein